MTWQSEAPCVGRTELFYPGQGNHTYDAARAICERCPVRTECELDMAAFEVDVALVHGFRAGLDPEHRKQLLKDRLGRTSGARKVAARQALAWQVEGLMTHEIADLLGMSKRNVARLLKDAKAELEAIEASVAA